MPLTNTQEVYEIRSISPQRINPSIMEGTQQYTSILGPDRAISIVRYAPIFLVAPLLTGDPGIPSVLTCSAGVVDASPSTRRFYHWFIDGVSSLNGEGPAFSTFLTDATMDAKTITCEVTALNILGEASAISNGILVGIIEPVIVGEYTNFGITGMSADSSITVFQDQIAVLTGMWVDDFVTVFQDHIFGLVGLGQQDHTSLFAYDVYSVNSYELLTNITVFNGGAESNNTSGWTVTAGTLRPVATSTPSGGGSYVFMGSASNNVDTYANHVTTISGSYYDEINTGECTLGMTFWACQDYAGQSGDHMQVTFDFLNASNTVLGSDDFFGLFEPEGKSRGGSNLWQCYVSPPVHVPVGTTKVRVNLFIDGRYRTGGSYCQFDLLSLQLYQPVV